jgi:hypothetical protein
VALCEGVLVRFEIEGQELDSQLAQKDENGRAQWNQCLNVVISSKNILCKVTVMDNRGMVKVSVATGRFVITREELVKAGIAETNRSLQRDNDSNTNEAAPFSADIIREVKLEPVLAPGEEQAPIVKKKGQHGFTQTHPVLTLHIQYQSWDLPKVKCRVKLSMKK